MADALVMLIFWLPVYLILGFTVALQHPVFSLLGVLLTAVYYTVFLSSKWQATPGKRLMNVYIVTAEQHAPLTPQRAFGRYAAYFWTTVLMSVYPLLSGTIPGVPSNLSPAEQQRFIAVQTKIMQREPVSKEEKAFFHEAVVSGTPALSFFSIFNGFYLLAIAATVAFTREKTGIHDMICKTRALRGRPGSAETTY